MDTSLGAAPWNRVIVSHSAHSPAAIRNKPTFAHKLCIRVATHEKKKTLSVTDLGSGMTRADMINGLGIGHLSHRALLASRRLSGGNAESIASEEEEVHDGDTAATSEEEEESVADYSESSEAVDEDETDAQEDDLSAGLPCHTLDIGGFYSALCSLGTQVTVGTKVSYIITPA